MLANRPGAAGKGQRGGPKSADKRFTLDAFFAAIGERATKDHIDDVAGVLAVGQFDEPLTGRTARIEAARRRLEAAVEARARRVRGAGAGAIPGRPGRASYGGGPRTGRRRVGAGADPRAPRDDRPARDRP